MILNKIKWKCKKCGYETDEDILYLTHIIENHPEFTKDEIVSACRFYKKFCNRMKYFLVIYGDDLSYDDRLQIGDFIANNDFKGFEKWLFSYTFNHFLS